MGKIVFISRPARAKAGYINKEGKDAIFILGLYGCYISIGSLWMLFFSLSFELTNILFHLGSSSSSSYLFG